MHRVSVTVLTLFSMMISPFAHAQRSSSVTPQIDTAIDECKSAEAAHPNQSTLQETKTAICFKGRIGRDTDRFIIPLISNKQKIFVVNSIGGDGIAAAKIGIHIIENHVDVVVHGLCLSSCANYIFLAGRRKYVAPSAILAWHGAPQSEPSPREKLFDNDGRRQLIYQLSQTIFDLSKADRRLAFAPDPSTPGFAAWKAGWDSRNVHFWTWSKKSLEQRFQVQGINAYWYPANPEILNDLGKTYGLELLVDVNH